MKKIILIALVLSGCAPGILAGLHDLQENNLGYVYCIDGSGPPFTGQGHIVAIGLKQGFKGQIVVRENCALIVDHDYYPPQPEKKVSVIGG